MKTVWAIAALALAGALASAQMNAPVASGAPTEIRGVIDKVGLAYGQGMPSLDVQAPDRTWKVWLGSMRYLMEQNFSPKAGQQVTVKGFKSSTEGELYAATVTLPASKQTIRLRDESGWPVWRGCCGAGRGMHRCQYGRQ